MYQVIKRNDKVVDFDLAKIANAIRKAFDAQSKQYNDSVIDFLALKVTADFEPKSRTEKSPSRIFRTAWSPSSSVRAMTTLPRPTSSTAASGRSCAT